MFNSLSKCDSCLNCGERYFYGSTARFCFLHEEFCHDCINTDCGYQPLPYEVEDEES